MVLVVNTGDTDGWSSAGLKKDSRLNERFLSVGSALFQGVRLWPACWLGSSISAVVYLKGGKRERERKVEKAKERAKKFSGAAAI